MGYQSIFYDISNQLHHCLWLLPPVSDSGGCKQPDLEGTGVLTGWRVSFTSSGRADVLQNQAAHWEDGAWECKEESLEFWGRNEAMTKADLVVRLECRQSLKYQCWAFWTWQTSPYGPVSLRAWELSVGIVLSLTLGHVEELESLGRKERLCFPGVQCWLFTSHLPAALQGCKPGLAANPLLVFPFYFPSSPLPSLESWWIFHCWFFSGGEITKWCLVRYQPAGFQSRRSGRNELFIREAAWGDTQLMVQQPEGKIWEIIYKSVLWQAKINLLQKVLCWCVTSATIFLSDLNVCWVFLIIS